MFNIPGLRYFHAGIGAIYLGLYTAVWCAGISLSKRTGFLFVVAAPAIWVALDFLKSHAGFLSFPWASVAQSQHGYPAVLQITTITGEYGITFVIVLINATRMSKRPTFYTKHGYYFAWIGDLVRASDKR
jgi:apolipoprotein N-acyltransferase